MTRLSDLFGFKGRISRGRFWGGVILAILLALLVFFITQFVSKQIVAYIGTTQAQKIAVFSTLLIAELFWFFVITALLAKRMHDFGMSGWIATIPLFFIVIFLLATYLKLVPSGYNAGLSVGRIIGFLYLLGIPIVGFWPGLSHENSYGSVPVGSDHSISWWQVLFALKGRITRKHFWIGLAIFLGITLLAINAASAIVFILGKDTSQVQIWFIFALFLFPSLFTFSALTVKRLHDIGKSGWLMLVPYVILFFGGWFLYLDIAQPGSVAEQGLVFGPPLIALLLFNLTAFWPGQPHDNKYSLAPLSISEKQSVWDRLDPDNDRLMQTLFEKHKMVKAVSVNLNESKALSIEDFVQQVRRLKSQQGKDPKSR